MDYLQILFFVVLVFAIMSGVYILAAKPTSGSALVAASLSGLFGGFTAIQIWQEGVVMFFTNHSVNMTGIQVWWDLVMCVVIAFFFIAPRARKQGMILPVWALIAGCTASIGLLAMCARLFWLENQSAAEDTKPATQAASKPKPA